MKQNLLILLLVLTGINLWAQLPGGQGGATRRPPRYGFTNNIPGAPPRYQPPGTANPAAPVNPAAPGGNPAVPPGGIPGALPGAGAPGAPLTTVDNASPAFARQQEEMIAPGLIDFEGVALSQVLDIYAKLVNRTMLRAALPEAQIILKTQTPLTRTEAIQALQAVLALNGVSLVNIGEKFVKVVPSDTAGTMGGELDRSGSTNLPNLGSYITHVVQLNYVKPTEMVPIIQPFARLANSILPIDSNGILVLRDYAENVKRMLEMIERVDVSVPAEYISEVIPIRYAKVDDIAAALNALGGGGGATVSVGSAPANQPISGVNRGMSSMGGLGGAGGGLGGGIGGGFGNNQYGGSGFGQRTGLGTTATPNGTPGSGTTFQQRLQNIINSTGPSSSGGGAGGNRQDIQLFGQTKIIPNLSSSQLLIYATRADMQVIKGIIDKLDVPLAQVLIEAAIIDYSLGPNTFNFGLSAAQNPAQSGNVIGAGGFNNGQSFLQFLSSVTTNGFRSIGTNLVPILGHTVSAVGTNGTFANSLPGGLSYFGSIGPTWDLALSAVASDSHASVIQRPRIQTSQAKPAQFFVGDTVPYVTGNSYGTAYGAGVSYSQLSVGVELDVTPFINPEGLVVMDIQQEIDDLNGFTTIDNVGQVPNTIKRSLNAEIAVRDRDTVMLGGFIKANKSTSRSGVPFLMNIPILGNLFLQRNDSKSREELIVLMRPTVLPTPELAARHTSEEEQRLPGVARAEFENAQEERKLTDAERKRQMRAYKANPKDVGFFTTPGVITNGADVRLDFQPQKSIPVPQTQEMPEVEEVTPIPQPVHPGPGIVPSPETQHAPENNSQPGNAVPPSGNPQGSAAPAPENDTATLDNAERQRRAQEALSQALMQPAPGN